MKGARLLHVAASSSVVVLLANWVVGRSVACVALRLRETIARSASHRSAVRPLAFIASTRAVKPQWHKACSVRSDRQTGCADDTSRFAHEFHSHPGQVFTSPF